MTCSRASTNLRLSVLTLLTDNLYAAELQKFCGDKEGKNRGRSRIVGELWGVPASVLCFIMEAGGVLTRSSIRALISFGKLRQTQPKHNRVAPSSLAQAYETQSDLYGPAPLWQTTASGSCKGTLIRKGALVKDNPPIAYDYKS